MMRRRWLSGNVAMDQFHRIFRFKGHSSGEQLIKCRTEGVEIGAIIQGAVHAPGLFRGHVRQCAFQHIRVSEREMLP